MLNYTWFLLPFFCLVVALVLPRYLIATIQATPASVTSNSGISSYSVETMVQRYLDLKIAESVQEIEKLRNMQKDQERRMEEMLFFQEQTSKTIEALAAASANAGSSSKSIQQDEVMDIVNSALKKSIREVVSHIE